MARAAKAAKPKKEISMEEALWKSADKLRGSVEPAEYKHVVLSLFFLKFASDKFEQRRREIIADGHEAYVDMPEFYTMKNVFFLPAESRWSFIMEHAKQDNIALLIDTALYTVEKNNVALKGALPDNYYSRLNLDTAKLASLLDEIDKINTDDEENDIIGRVYEYFLGKFALAEGKGKGEFYTPKCIVNLIAELIEPYKGKIYEKTLPNLIQSNDTTKKTQKTHFETRDSFPLAAKKSIPKLSHRMLFFGLFMILMRRGPFQLHSSVGGTDPRATSRRWSAHPGGRQ